MSSDLYIHVPKLTRLFLSKRSCLACCCPLIWKMINDLTYLQAGNNVDESDEAKNVTKGREITQDNYETSFPELVKQVKSSKHHFR